MLDRPEKRRRRKEGIIVYEKEKISSAEKRRIRQGKVSVGLAELELQRASSQIVWVRETAEVELVRLKPVIRSRLVIHERDGILRAERRPVVVDYSATGRVRRRVPYHIMELALRELRAGIVDRSKTALQIRNSKHLSPQEKDELLALLTKVL